jgi:hypothetical protein
MAKKKYPATAKDVAAANLAVNETKAQAYGQKKRRPGLRAISNIAAVKRRLKKPVKRSKHDIAWALEIAGIGQGPVDLSERVPKYLYGNK